MFLDGVFENQSEAAGIDSDRTGDGAAGTLDDDYGIGWRGVVSQKTTQIGMIRQFEGQDRSRGRPRMGPAGPLGHGGPATSACAGLVQAEDLAARGAAVGSDLQFGSKTAGRKVGGRDGVRRHVQGPPWGGNKVAFFARARPARLPFRIAVHGNSGIWCEEDETAHSECERCVLMPLEADETGRPGLVVGPLWPTSEVHQDTFTISRARHQGVDQSQPGRSDVGVHVATVECQQWGLAAECRGKESDATAVGFGCRRFGGPESEWRSRVTDQQAVEHGKVNRAGIDFD